MKLTPEDFERLHTKDLANVITKLQERKPLSASDRAVLERERARVTAETPAPAVSFVHTWGELARALHVSLRALKDWRNDARYKQHCPPDRDDGRKEVAAWSAFMVRFSLKRADEQLEVDDDAAEGEPRTVADWKMRREMREVQRIERNMLKDDGLLLVASELEVAVGQLLAGIQTALTIMPGAAARFLVGIRDVHVVQQRLQDEIDAVLTQLNLARYLEAQVPDIVAELYPEGDDTLLVECSTGVLRELGRRALAEITSPARDAADVAGDSVTGQISDEASARHTAARQITPVAPAVAAPTPSPKPETPPPPPPAKPAKKQRLKDAVPKTKPVPVRKSPRKPAPKKSRRKL